MGGGHERRTHRCRGWPAPWCQSHIEWGKVLMRDEHICGLVHSPPFHKCIYRNRPLLRQRGDRLSIAIKSVDRLWRAYSRDLQLATNREPNQRLYNGVTFSIEIGSLSFLTVKSAIKAFDMWKCSCFENIQMLPKSCVFLVDMIKMIMKANAHGLDIIQLFEAVALE